MIKSLKKAVNNIKKEKFLNLSNLFVVIVTFLILGIFMYVFVYTQTALKSLEQQAQVTLFFKDDFPEEKILETQKTLNSDERIFETKYVSKEDAFKIFMDLNKDEPVLLENISASILPASLEIRTKNLGDLGGIAEEFSKMDGVEEVRYFKEVIEKFKTWSTVIYIAGGALLFIFLAVSYSVIISTIRTTIHSKGVELEILKLVGASDEYVKKPLLVQGVILGAGSGLAAGFLLAIVAIWIKVLGLFSGGLTLAAFLPELVVNQIVFMLIVWVLLVLSGVVLGYFSSYAAVKKYLKY
jgi:cell division transport system permease protein